MRLHAFLFVLSVAEGLLAPLTASAQPGHFAFDAARATPGVVYHYLKTNLDGSAPEHVSLYVAAADRIEVFKFHPGELPAALVVAEMDWATASARRLESWHVNGGDERVLGATLDYREGTRAVEISIPPAGLGPEALPVPTLLSTSTTSTSPASTSLSPTSPPTP